jgi:hypothetical protein
MTDGVDARKLGVEVAAISPTMDLRSADAQPTQLIDTYASELSPGELRH